MKIFLKTKTKGNLKCYHAAIDLNVYEENILVTDGEDKVLTSTKYGSKTSVCDTAVKVTYQEIYI